MNLVPASKTRFQVFDMTPMIDVVFQLIIFFMFTSQFGELTRTDIDLPRQKGEQSPALDKPALVIDMQLNGGLFVDSQPVSLEQVARLVRIELDRSESPETFLVQVRPDRNAMAVHLNKLTERLAEIGVRRWKIGTTDPGGAGP